MTIQAGGLQLYLLLLLGLYAVTVLSRELTMHRVNLTSTNIQQILKIIHYDSGDYVQGRQFRRSAQTPIQHLLLFSVNVFFWGSKASKLKRRLEVSLFPHDNQGGLAAEFHTGNNTQGFVYVRNQAPWFPHFALYFKLNNVTPVSF